MSSIRGASTASDASSAFDTLNESNIIQYAANNELLILCGVAIIFTGFLLGVAFSNIRGKDIKEAFNMIKGYFWRKRLQFCNKRIIKAKQSPFPSPMKLPMTHMEANKLTNEMTQRSANITNHRTRKESISYQPLNVNDEYRITLYAVLEEMPHIKV